MDYKELSEHYYKLTGFQAFDEPTLILRFIMSDKLRPYLTKVKMRGILKTKIVIDEINSFYDFKISGFRTQYLISSYNPTLLGFLLNHENTKHILKYLFENWNLFYDDLDQVLYDILHVYGIDEHLHDYLDKRHDDIIIKFCSHWDIIPTINKFQSKRIYGLGSTSMGLIHNLVCLYDVNNKYKIRDLYNLVYICIKKGHNLEKLIQKYNLNFENIQHECGLVPLTMSALRAKNKSSFLFLYNEEELIRSFGPEYLALLMGYDEEILKLTDNYEIDYVKLASMFSRMCVSSMNQEACRTLEDYMGTLNKYTKDVKDFVSIIKSSEYKNYPTKKCRLFDLLYHKLDDFRGDVLYGEILKNEYSIDVLFKPNNNPQIWKQNFMLMLQLHRNYYMLTVSSY